MTREQQTADDPQTTIDMLRSWLVEADASCRALTEHLNSVIEIAETWQPDYATKMDLDTIRFAKERLPARGQVAATQAEPEAQQPLTESQVDTVTQNHWLAIRTDAMSAHRAFANPMASHRSFARAIERACAEAWGVKLAGIGASGEAS